MARAREDAKVIDLHFVSRTAWRDFEEPIPRLVMNAYMVMVEEALAQLPDPRAVTHVVMQGGVGSIAAAIFTGFAKLAPPQLPRFIIVEPSEADRLFPLRSSPATHAIAGTLHTIMAGLACRAVSPAA